MNKYNTIEELREAIKRGDEKIVKRYPKGYEAYNFLSLDLAGKYIFEKYGKKFNSKVKTQIFRYAKSGKIATINFNDVVDVKDGTKSTKGYSKKDLDKCFKT